MLPRARTRRFRKSVIEAVSPESRDGVTRPVQTAEIFKMEAGPDRRTQLEQPNQHHYISQRISEITLHQ